MNLVMSNKKNKWVPETVESEANKLLSNLKQALERARAIEGNTDFQEVLELLNNSKVGVSSLVLQQECGMVEKSTGKAGLGLGLIGQFEKILSGPVWKETKSVLLGVYQRRLSDMLNRLRAVKRGCYGVQHNSQTVYVSLYHSDGISGLSVWVSMLKRIHRSLLSRPVFLCERDAEASLGQSECWSYVELLLPQSVVVMYDGRYSVRAEHVTIDHIQSFYWRKMKYRFNGIGLSSTDKSDTAFVASNSASVELGLNSD